MRIIDNNKDFYDYCQNIYRDDLNTFDRRDSYNLTKEELVRKFSFDRTKFLLLQACNTFWLFQMTVTEPETLPHSAECTTNATDYDLALLAKWKDYDVKSVCLELSKLNFRHSVFPWYDQNITDKVIANMKQAIHTNDFLVPKNTFNKFTLRISGKTEVKHIPILKNTGIASFVNPEELYFAIDEYFSKVKTESERTESIDLTDVDKITNHGFDTKTSFRGKNK